MEMLKKGLKVGLKTTWTLGKIIFPITLIITILGFTPFLDWLASMLAPLMGWIGLPGEAAIPLVLGNVLNLYAAIGAILSMDLTVKEVFILAVMLSFSHNLFVESAVAVKVGIRMSVVLAVRLGLALFSALMIHWIWQGGANQAQYGFVSQEGQSTVNGWEGAVWEGLTSAIMGVVQLALVVIPIMVFIQVMKDLNWLQVFSKWMSPFTKMLGIRENTSTTLASGIIFGLAFGAGVMIQAIKEDNVKKKDLYLVFIFLVACHAVIEDTLIFIPLGIPVLPLLLIRLVTAVLLTILIAYIWNKSEKREFARKEATYDY
ncbi:nucleoside recognition domain-containing protein [Alteribacillus bidgolensis]|uniref:Nucleoside recognition n=1 Tax=Alteribacillus bidgolensis TaxID=930129 RepID=A0A1G8E810_9BACI|nr:nucleoside recognition domain-containing protein [Alteribacillus bidgolensis]SDH66044.1 Nucleoside recognition [Alteribacillus bidgolensis]